jgi:hypothetical protein
MIYDKNLKLPNQILNKFLKNKSNKEKKRLIKGVKDLIKLNELFEINENYINSYSTSNLNELSSINEYVKSSNDSLNQTYYTSKFEDDENDNDYNEIELELINQIYTEITKIAYYPGDTELQRKYVFYKINELISED